MTTYVDLGPRGPVTGKADTTGQNFGNWTVTFDPNLLNTQLPFLEIYRIIAKGAPFSSFSVFVDQKQWDSNVYGTQNSWEASGPGMFIVRPGQTVNFFWNDPVSDNNPPVVTIYLRYDQDVDQNARAARIQGA